MVMTVVCLGFASCSNDNDEPEDATWSTVCEVKFEISQDMLDVLDITAHIANPDGTIREERVSKTNPRWTLKGEKIPNNAGVYLSFAPKNNLVDTDIYDVKFMSAYTTFSYKNNNLVDSRTYSRDCDCSMSGETVKEGFVEKGVGIASGIDSHGSIIDVDISEIDFGLNSMGYPWFTFNPSDRLGWDFWGWYDRLYYDEGKEEKPLEGDWSTCYEVKFQVNYFMFDKFDITAHIACPDGTYREEPVVYEDEDWYWSSPGWNEPATDAVVSWTMNDDDLNDDYGKSDDKAAVVLTFVPKQESNYDYINCGLEYRIEASITASVYKGGIHVTSDTYSEKCEGNMEGDKIELFAEHGLGISLQVGTWPNVYIDPLCLDSDFDFDIEPGWSDWTWLFDYNYGR